MKLEDNFESRDFRQRRQAAARAIGSSDPSDAEEVLDFFENIGLLTRRRALDKEMVWSSFFYWINGYCQFAHDYIEAQCGAYPTRYTDLVWLHKQILAVEREKHGTLDEKEWANFIEEEQEQKRPQILT